MKILVSINPFDNEVHLSIVDLTGLTSDLLYNVAQIAEETTRKNIEDYLGINNKGKKMNEDIYEEIVICKYCGNPVKWGDLIWKNGKCMCPKCYAQEEELEGDQDDE